MWNLEICTWKAGLKRFNLIGRDVTLFNFIEFHDVYPLLSWTQAQNTLYHVLIVRVCTKVCRTLVKTWKVKENDCKMCEALNASIRHCDALPVYKSKTPLIEFKMLFHNCIQLHLMISSMFCDNIVNSDWTNDWPIQHYFPAW